MTVGRAEANNNISNFFKWDLSTNQITNLGTILINPRLSSWTTKANTISIFQYQNKIIFLYNKTWIDGSAIVVYDTSTGKLASLATAALIQTEIVNLNNHLYFIDSNNLLNVVNLNDLSIDNYQLGTIKNFVSVTSIDNQIYLLKQGDNYKENNTLYALTFNNHNAVLNKIYAFPYNTDINNSFAYKNSTYLSYMTLKQVNKNILIDFNVTQLANQKVLNTKTIYTLNINKFKLRFKHNFNINSNKINLTMITPPLYSTKSIIESNSYYISYNLDKNQVSTNTFTMKEPGTIKHHLLLTITDIILLFQAKIIMI